MKCARVHLQERFKSKRKPVLVDKPLRYCQKRLVNPEHEEDAKWTAYERFHCIAESSQTVGETTRRTQDSDYLYLTVQTLRFQGDVEQTKRYRSTFIYKIPTDGAKHRMFVKQVVPHTEYSDDDQSSQTTCYYFDDYVKYLVNNDKSRPTSGKSSLFLQDLNNKKENKAIKVNGQSIESNKTAQKIESKLIHKYCKQEINDENKVIPEVADTKFTFHKSGKRKSLTISRVQSPETVQVIRVDVVCNYSSSSVLSNYDNIKVNNFNPETNNEHINMKSPHFANKYLLTNTNKTLDENLSGGAKVTLYCKTFKLSERVRNKFKYESDKFKELEMSKNKSTAKYKLAK